MRRHQTFAHKTLSKTRPDLTKTALLLAALSPLCGTSLEAQVRPATTVETRRFAREIVEAVVESATGLPSQLALPEAHVSWHSARLSQGDDPALTMTAAIEMAEREGRAAPRSEFGILRRFAEEFRAGREVFGVSVVTHCLATVDPVILATHDFDITYEVEYSGGDAFLYRMMVAAVEGPDGLHLGSRPGGASVELVSTRGC